jgi:replicative DNA helicase
LDIIQELKGFDLKSYIESKVNQEAKKAGIDTYKFTVCPICKGGDHFTINTKDNLFNTWGNCGGGSIIDFTMGYNGIDKGEAIKQLESEFNLNFEGGKNNMSKIIKDVKPISKSAKTYKEIDLTSSINDYYISDENILVYPVLERGIQNDDIINKYKLLGGNIKEIFKDNLKLLPNLKNIDSYENVIPVWENGKVVNCILRRNDKKSLENAKTLNLKDVEVKIFNSDYLKDKAIKEIYITEGIYDCLSLECLGYKSICLNSINMANKFIELAIKNINSIKYTKFVLALDNDDKGQKTTTLILEKMKKLGLNCIEFKFNAKYKDINEYHVKDQSGLLLEFEKADINSVYYFLENNFYNEVNKYVFFENKNTGFKKLDNLLGNIYPALYLIGAESSLGKTTFVHQIADNIASQNSGVLYFSLEQSKFELISKSLSRIAYKYSGEKVTSSDIMYNTNMEATEKAINRYKEYSKNMIIHQGNFETDITEIKNKTLEYIKLTGKSPVIIVDYLQVIKPLQNQHSDKQIIDTNIKELKRMSRDLFIPIFVVSSINRGNYLCPVNYEAFKESGSIEFTADVLIGLQYKKINEIQDIKKVTEQREIMRNEKLSNPRLIELVCLKNRGGKQTFKVDFKYFASYNYFVEI